jgi:hypothetical protein
LLVEKKYSELDFESESYSKIDKGKQINDRKTNVTISTIKFQPKEPKELEEGECLYHSNMWVKGMPLHFIFDIGS